MDLALDHQATLVLVHELDGILDGNVVVVTLGVHLVWHGGVSGGISSGCRCPCTRTCGGELVVMWRSLPFISSIFFSRSLKVRFMNFQMSPSSGISGRFLAPLLPG